MVCILVLIAKARRITVSPHIKAISAKANTRCRVTALRWVEKVDNADECLKSYAVQSSYLRGSGMANRHFKQLDTCENEVLVVVIGQIMLKHAKG